MIMTLSGHTQNVTSLAWAGDGSHLASTSRDGTIRIWNPDIGQPTQIVQVGNPVYSVDFSPDGTQFAYNTSTGVVIATVADEAESTPTPTPAAQYTQPNYAVVAWSPDGTMKCRTSK